MKPLISSTVLVFLSFLLLLGCGKNDMNTVYIYTTVPNSLEKYTVEVNSVNRGEVPFSGSVLDFSSDSLNYKTVVMLLQRGKHTMDLLNSKMEKVSDGSLKIKRNGYGASGSGNGSKIKINVSHTENKFLVHYEKY